MPTPAGISRFVRTLSLCAWIFTRRLDWNVAFHPVSGGNVRDSVVYFISAKVSRFQMKGYHTEHVGSSEYPEPWPASSLSFYRFCQSRYCPDYPWYCEKWDATFSIIYSSAAVSWPTYLVFTRLPATAHILYLVPRFGLSSFRTPFGAFLVRGSRWYVYVALATDSRTCSLELPPRG